MTSLTAAERRLLDALRRSVETHGRPTFATRANYARDNRAVLVGYRDVEGMGRVPTTVSFRGATLAALREKGLIDADDRPLPPSSESGGSA